MWQKYTQFNWSSIFCWISGHMARNVFNKATKKCVISSLFSHHHTTKSHLNCLSQFNNVKLVWHRFKWLNGYHQTTEPVCRLPVPKTKLEQIVYCTTNIFCTVFFFLCKGLFVDIYNKCHIHHRKQWWVFVKSGKNGFSCRSFPNSFNLFLFVKSVAVAYNRIFYAKFVIYLLTTGNWRIRIRQRYPNNFDK